MAAVEHNLDDSDASNHPLEDSFAFLNTTSSDDSAVGSSHYSSSGGSGSPNRSTASSRKIDVNELLARLRVEEEIRQRSQNASIATAIGSDEDLDDDSQRLVCPPPSANTSMLDPIVNAFSCLRQKFSAIQSYFFKEHAIKDDTLGFLDGKAPNPSPSATINHVEDTLARLAPVSEDSTIGSYWNTSSSSDDSVSANRTTKSQKINSIQDVQQLLAKLRAEDKACSRRLLLENDESTATAIDSDDDLDDLAYCDRLRDKFATLEARAPSYYHLYFLTKD
uniref:Fibrous sheath-interacting protein 1 n=1 Tax=Panagrellus redivivus TaxID=6233 RepID=A0A7E4ZZQ9_PANRE